MVWLYFAVAFGITWLVQLPAVLAHYGILPGPEAQYMNPAGFGLFGPMIAAFIVTRIEGRGGFFRSLWKWRVSPIWYLVALFLPAVAYLVVRGIGGMFVANPGPWLWPPGDGQRIAAMIIAPIGEEIGWRGYALPRLQERYSRLQSAVILGALWGLWHLMMYLMAGVTVEILVASILFLIPGSIFYSWIYNRAGGSAFLAILVHMSAHLNNPNQALPGNITPFWFLVVVYSILGIAVLADHGVNAAQLAAVRVALVNAGAEVQVISQQLGNLVADDGSLVEVDQASLHVGSVLFDAVYVPGGAASVEALKDLGDSIHFINEAFRHDKPLGATEEGVELLVVSRIKGVSMADPGANKTCVDCGVVTMRGEPDSSTFTTAFLEAIAAHRHWDRPEKDAVPA